MAADTLPQAPCGATRCQGHQIVVWVAEDADRPSEEMIQRAIAISQRRPLMPDIRIGSRVLYGDLDWIVSRIDTGRHVTYVTLKPPKNRTGKNSSMTAITLIGNVRLAGARGSGGGAMSNQKINPFPPQGRGLWRAKRYPYPLKACWAEAPFGDRWRALKARLSLVPAASVAAQGAPR